MDSSTLISTFCLAVSFVLASSAYDQVNLKKSPQQYGNSAVQQTQFTLPSLPRKFKLQEEADVKSSVDKDVMLHKKLESSSGEKEAEKEENVVNHAARKVGTWREWVESPNKSEYFTMDYAWVRRRRPIHNKQIPFVP